MLRRILLGLMATLTIGAPLALVATPANATTAGCVTRAEFDRVSEGMTMAEVHRILGTSGVEDYDDGSDIYRTYRGCSDLPGTLSANFDNYSFQYEYEDDEFRLYSISYDRASTPAPAPNTMSQHRAARFYLAQVCAGNDAVDHLWNVAPTRRDGRVYSTDLRGRALTRVKAAAGNVARVQHNEARAMYHPPAAWPSNVAGLVNRMASLIERESQQYRSMSYARAGGQFIRIWNRISGQPTRLSGQIRARLNLPAPGRGC